MTATRVPPGPKGQFLLGNTLQFFDPLVNLPKWAREFGDVYSLRFPGLVYYVFNHPEQIEYVLRSHAKNFKKDVLTH